VLDGGAPARDASTVIDLRAFETTRDWVVVREGAVEREAVRAALDAL
jgi:tRNA A37 threonylcarbamoyladenosine synthetase subunit TsaC/SUA5/YrdC